MDEDAYLGGGLNGRGFVRFGGKILAKAFSDVPPCITRTLYVSHDDNGVPMLGVVVVNSLK